MKEKLKILPTIERAAIFDSHQKFKGNTNTIPRKTQTYEFELYSADGGCSIVNNIVHKIKKGDILCTKPQQERSSFLHFKCYYIYLSVNEGYFKTLLDELPDFMTTSDTKKYTSIFNSVIEMYNSPFEGSDLLLDSIIVEFIYLLYRDSLIYKRQSLLPIKTDSSVVTKAVKFISENIENNISLSDIAESVNLSPIYFHKVFTALTTKTPHEYLLERRITVAKNLLITGELNQSEIAVKCGFSSQSYFTSVFKKEVGLTPRDYRGKMSLKEEL